LRRDLRSQDALDLLSASFARMRSAGLAAGDELKLRSLEIDDYGRVLERHPDWTEALFRRASQRLALERLLPRADAAGRGTELAAAVAELQQTLKGLSPGSPDRVRSSAHFQLGRAYAAQSALPQADVAALRENAVRQFSEAALSDPERADALAELVQIRLAQRKADAAIDKVRNAIPRSRSKSAQATLNAMLGNLLLEKGDAKRALQPLERSIELDPLTPHAYIGLLKAHRSLGDEDDAHAAMERAVSAIPGFVTAYLELGRMAVARGDHESAIARFVTLLKIPPDNAVVIGTRPSRNAFRNSRYHAAAAWLAWLFLEKRNDPESAIKAVRISERYGALDTSLMNSRGWARFQLGRLQEARGDLQWAAAQPDASPGVHYRLARVLQALGENEAALAAVDNALSLNRDFDDSGAAEKLRQELSSR
jgi:tetratricopeptide (TPR) repeat protein